MSEDALREAVEALEAVEAIPYTANEGHLVPPEVMNRVRAALSALRSPATGEAHP